MTWARRGGAFGEGYSLLGCEPGGVNVLLTLRGCPQAGPHDCGEAAVRTVLRYWKVRGADAVRFATPQDGSDPRTLEAAMRLAGLHVLSGEMTADDLRHFCNAGKPVVALIQAHGAGHYVCTRGISRGWVYYYDPAAGEAKSRVADFAAAWHDADRLNAVFRSWGVVAYPR